MADSRRYHRSSISHSFRNPAPENCIFLSPFHLFCGIIVSLPVHAFLQRTRGFCSHENSNDVFLLDPCPTVTFHLWMRRVSSTTECNESWKQSRKRFKTSIHAKSPLDLVRKRSPDGTMLSAWIGRSKNANYYRHTMAVLYRDPFGICSCDQSDQGLLFRKCLSRRVSSDREDELVRQTKSKARKLIQMPKGTFSSMEYQQTKKIMSAFRRFKTFDAESANLSISLMEKVTSEISETGNHTDGRFIFDQKLVSPLIRRWREVAVKTKNVLSPKDLLRKLQVLSHSLPEFPYDVRTMSIILDVIIKQEERKFAPTLAEELLSTMEDYADVNMKSSMQPDVVIYTQVLKAWADSGCTNAPEKIHSILDKMKQRDVKKSHITFSILLRFWAGRTDVSMVEHLLASMSVEGLPPNRTALSSVIYCYCKKGETDKAESVFRDFLDVEPTNSVERNMLGECAQSLMMAYRNIIDSASSNKYRNDRVLENVETFYKRVQNHPDLEEESEEKLTGTMMDIYSRMNRFDRIEDLSQSTKLDAINLNILIKALGINDQANRASDIVKRLIQNPIFCDVVNIRVISTVINAWAESSKPNAFDQALSFFRTVTTEPKYVEMGLRPDAVTYACLLKCLSQRPREDAGKIVLELIDEMESSNDEDLKPNDVCYTVGIKVCLQNNLCKIAEALMERMTSAGISPDLRTYIEILNYWSNVRTQESAERVEQIVDYMKELAKSNPDLMPNTICYTILLSAWALANVKISADKMWSIYNGMISNAIHPTIVTLTALISFFAQTANRQHIQRADDLLYAFEKSSDSNMVLDYRHFSHVINGWLSINDVNRATSVLIRQVDAFVNQKNPDASPDAPTIDKVARGFVKKGDLVRATTLLEKFKKLNDDNVLPIGPDLCSHQYLLSQWKKSQHPEKWHYIRKLDKAIVSLQQ